MTKAHVHAKKRHQHFPLDRHFSTIQVGNTQKKLVFYVTLEHERIRRINIEFKEEFDWPISSLSRSIFRLKIKIIKKTRKTISKQNKQQSILTKFIKETVQIKTVKNDLNKMAIGSNRRKH